MGVLRGAALAGLVGVTLVWGLNWPIMKFSLRELSPLFFRAATMTGGSLLLLAWFSARGHDMRLPRSAWAPVALLAAPNVLGWHLFSILGVQELASGRAAILGFTMPIWTTLLAVLFFGERLTARVMIGAAGAAIAITLLVAHEFVALAGRPVGIVWMQIAALSWALGTILMRRTRLALSTQAITVWMMLLSSAAFWLIAPVFEPWPRWQFSAPMWVALAWGAAINYGIAQVVWFNLARTLPPTASAFSIMAVPIVGTVSAIAIVGEVPRWQDWAAALAVILAIASALLGRPASR
jgi:drug/metabolite transporter (DMT)-like permease